MRPINSELDLPSTSASRNRGSSKALSDRLRTSVGTDPHPVTRGVWWWTKWLTLASLLASVAYVLFADDPEAFQANHVSAPHQPFAQDCARCHTTWGPARRLLASFNGEQVWSVSNKKCEECHAGSVHHANQWPGHEPIAGTDGEFLSCAKCHREHRGDVDVSRSDDAHCTACHANLPNHARPELTDPAWTTSVTAFAEESGHPEFALIRRLEGEEQVPRDVVVRFFERAPELDALVLPKGAENPSGERWQDPGRVRFNHFAHLSRAMPVVDDEENAARWGDRIDAETQTVNLACADCHQPDAAGEYMQPIDYANHCRICHPIRFDTTERFRDVLVPHAGISAAERVRKGSGIQVMLGFVADQYAAERTEGREDDEPADPLVGFPGRPARSVLTAGERDAVRRSVNTARDRLLRDLTPEEREQLRSVVNLVGTSARGGCRFCHEVTTLDESPYLRIEPTDIPDRWMPHSRFSHARHRELACVACHADHSDPSNPRPATESFDTGDVLMPAIESCRHCHTPTPSERALGSARSDCVECHLYHDHTLDPLEKGLNLLLEPIERQEDSGSR